MKATQSARTRPKRARSVTRAVSRFCPFGRRARRKGRALRPSRATRRSLTFRTTPSSCAGAVRTCRSTCAHSRGPYCSNGCSFCNKRRSQTQTPRSTRTADSPPRERSDRRLATFGGCAIALSVLKKDGDTRRRSSSASTVWGTIGCGGSKCCASPWSQKWGASRCEYAHRRPCTRQTNNSSSIGASLTRKITTAQRSQLSLNFVISAGYVCRKHANRPLFIALSLLHHRYERGHVLGWRGRRRTKAKTCLSQVVKKRDIR